MRESRQELRKYQREVKKNNPSAVCQLQYDKLFVNHRCYVWSDLQGRVVPHNPVRTTSHTYIYVFESELQTKVLRDCKIFANLRLKL